MRPGVEMSTPFDYCPICDGWGGNGAPCGRCGHDAGSPLRLAPEKDEDEVGIARRWELFTKACERIPQGLAPEEFQKLAKATMQGCQVNTCMDIVSFSHRDSPIWATYCQACGNAEYLEVG